MYEKKATFNIKAQPATKLLYRDRKFLHYYVTKWSFILIKKTFKNIKIFSVAELTGQVTEC